MLYICQNLSRVQEHAVESRMWGELPLITLDTDMFLVSAESCIEVARNPLWCERGTQSVCVGDRTARVDVHHTEGVKTRINRVDKRGYWLLSPPPTPIFRGNSFLYIVI